MSAVSVVATVRNETGSIDDLLQGLAMQTRQPNEVVIVDGGSTDGTFARLQDAARADARLRVLRAPGATISQGRNLAIERAHGPIIAVTDAGTTVDPSWLDALVRPLEASPDVAVSAGFYRPGGARFFERCLSTVITPQLPEIDPATFLPSSRSVAFRKEWWQRVGGYPEWLRHCEDLVFDLELKRAGALFAFAPDAVVMWRARPTLWRFMRQYFDYARGDGHAHLWTERHLVRYTAYASGLALLIAGFAWPIAWAILLAAGLLYLSKFGRRLTRLPPSNTIGGRTVAYLLAPVIVAAGDLAKMVGYPRGRWERWWARSPARLAPPRTIVVDDAAA